MLMCEGGFEYHGRESGPKVDPDALGEFEPLKAIGSSNMSDFLTETVLEERVVVGCYPLSSDVQIPERQTLMSACSDVHANFSNTASVVSYNSLNEKVNILVEGGTRINIPPGSRALIPTNIMMDIPYGYKVTLLPRSGLALKKGLSLANALGTIDADYVDPVFAILENRSQAFVSIEHGERVCQAEVSKLISFDFEKIDRKPVAKSDRNGGLGSTG